MKTKQYLSAVACLLSAMVLGVQLDAQKQQYDIRFNFKTIHCPSNQVCFETQLRSSNDVAWNLGGQNYRIFYDVSKATYVSGSLRRSDGLSEVDYSNILLTDLTEGASLPSSTADLNFLETLGFLNYSVDLMNLSRGGVTLPNDGSWLSTTELCFDVAQSVIDEGSSCLDFVWARPGKSDDIASAFVQVSEWAAPDSTAEAVGVIYDDLNAEDGDIACLTTMCDPDAPSNENTVSTCSDGFDNDRDGLIDCADPDCTGLTPCPVDTKEFQLSLELNTTNINCSTGMVCYNVNLRSGNDQSFILGSQRYQLFYNSLVGSFVNGTSFLGANYQALVTLDDTPSENINSTGVGDLPYESTLGYVNFAINQDNPAVNPGVVITPDAALTVAELCFSMTDDAISQSNVCFSSNWAREGLTTPYNRSVVQIEEWVSPNTTMETNGLNFGDLSPASGDDACFNVTCQQDNEQGDNQCSDNIDNDNDGLIDCGDPGCGNVQSCVDQCSAQAPTISGN